MQGRTRPEHPEDPEERKSIVFDFYSGVELHPHIFGVDVKQLTNCRIGMMGWQIFLCAFYMACVERHGFSTPALIHLLLQVKYFLKCYHLYL